MAEERNESRELNWRTLLPWTDLFRGFQIALDPNKLLLAAIGIISMAAAWWLLAFIFSQFYNTNPPDYLNDYLNKNPGATAEKEKALWAEYSRDRHQWNLMHQATGMGNKEKVQLYELEDLVSSKREYDAITAEINERRRREAEEKAKNPNYVAPAGKDKYDDYRDLVEKLPQTSLDESKDQLLVTFKAKLGKPKPAGVLNTPTWFEDRGPNPFLLVTGQTGRPWEAGHFWDWFFRDQLRVVIEPVVKLVLPLVFFFQADGLPAFYFFLVFAVTVAIWSLVGGAITRIAAVQIARGEKIDFMEAVRFTLKRWSSYLMAPIYPLGFIVVLILFAILFGVLHMIPFFGDILVSGLFWPIPLLLGFIIGLAVVGLVVGWPLMAPTISAEGTDSWEALSRSFSYVFQKPFHYLWYALVAITYGAVLIFFVGFLGSFTVYLSKWAVTQTPLIKYTKRDPVYLFIYAPDSFGWRELLLKDKLIDGDPLVQDGRINQDAYERYTGANNKKMSDPYDQLTGWNKFAAGMVAFWLFLVFLLIIGFGYSLFWSLMTIIYFLLRRDVDAAELDEVYLEEDEHDLAYSGPLTPPPTGPPTSSKTGQQPSSMVDAPALRTTGPTTSTPMPSSTPTAPPSTGAAPLPLDSTPTAAAPAADAAAPMTPTRTESSLTTDGHSPPS